MIERFKIGQGVTEPVLQGTLRRENDTSYDISTASAVFRMWRADTREVVINNVAAEIVSTTQLKYVWQAGDTDVAGDYEGVFIITYAGGGTEVAPGGAYGEPDYIPITITEIPSVA